MEIKLIITALTFLFTLTSATPVSGSFQLAKRGGESVKLVNCNEKASRVYYYDNDGNYPPKDQQVVTSGSYATWEGRRIDTKFQSTGVTYTSNINSNGQQVGNYQYAGSGTNYYKNFACYKDDKHGISGTSCQSVYYCFP